MHLLIFVFCGTNQQRMWDQSELHRGRLTTLKIKRRFAHFCLFFFLHFFKIFFMQLLIFVFYGTNQQRMSDQSELHRGGSTTLKIKRQFAHFLPVFFFLHFLKIFFMQLLIFVFCGTNQQRMSDQSELHRGGSTTLKIKHWFAHFLPVFSSIF